MGFLPSATRLWQPSHLVMWPLAALYCGAPYGQAMWQ
ncbi:Uncharacterised protein [Klebsiella pneumoniae]|nr:Uncharacterised protein [Klebsiella pneumoniae]